MPGPGSLRLLAAALQTQWKRYRKKLKRCQKKFSEAAVHDSRVETRRLLALVELLAAFLTAGQVRKAERALKRHLDTFSDLRDTQVQLLVIGKLRRAFPAARSFYQYLLKREDRLTKKARKAIKGVKTRRLGKLISDCQAEATRQGNERTPTAANALLLRSVERGFARARQLRARIDPQDTATIHRTRVAFKKFRYMVETLAGYLPLANRKLLVAMHDYQTLMGNIQDAEVLLATLEKYLLKKKLKPELARRFRQALLDRRQLLIRNYLKAADQLLEFWPLRIVGQASRLPHPAGVLLPACGGLPRAN